MSDSLARGARSPLTVSRRPAPWLLGARFDACCDGLLATGVILASASQFRVVGLPVGPGEACLTTWIGLRILRAWLDRPAGWSRAARALLAFWLAFTVAQALGLLTAMSLHGPVNWSLVLHDAFAFIFAALLSSLCVSGLDVAFRLQRATRYAMVIGAVFLSLQIASASGAFVIEGIDPWYWDRFRGWADNPNQLSLFSAVLVPICIFAMESGRRAAERLIALCCGLQALTLGILTKGNTMRLGFTVMMCCIALTFARRLLVRRDPRRQGRTLVLVLLVVSVPLLLASLLPYASTLRTDDVAQQISRDKEETLSEADLRFELWSGAFQRGLESHLLGLGPGPHVPVPAAVTTRRKWEANAAEESLGEVAKHEATMESHNTFLELFSQGGLLLVLAFGGLLLYAGRQAVASGSTALPALLCVVVVFGLFHVIFRHPVVWFGLALALAGKRSGNARCPDVSHATVSHSAPKRRLAGRS